MLSNGTAMTHSFDTHHTDLIHDAQLSYYGTLIATCSSDTTTLIHNATTHALIAKLTGHSGPVWQVGWSHPKFGNLLATASYDSTVNIYSDVGGKWVCAYTHKAHTASVNAVSWAPHEAGASLACASSDSSVSILTALDGNWSSVAFTAHDVGVNSVSWAPFSGTKRLVTGGCDNAIKIWTEGKEGWTMEHQLNGHSDWVRDVAWCPALIGKQYIASCSQDKTVLIWSKDNDAAAWKKNELKSDVFGDVVWRVSWSPFGNVLAVATGDNKVTLWKEGTEGWVQVGDVQEGS